MVGEGEREAEGEADGEQDEGFAEDHPEDGFGLCAEGEADADFVGAADDVVAHDAVEADGGERQGEQGEDAGERGDELVRVDDGRPVRGWW